MEKKILMIWGPMEYPKNKEEKKKKELGIYVPTVVEIVGMHLILVIAWQRTPATFHPHTKTKTMGSGV